MVGWDFSIGEVFKFFYCDVVSFFNIQKSYKFNGIKYVKEIGIIIEVKIEFGCGL